MTFTTATRTALIAAAAFVSVAATATSASAVSSSVRMACASDYFAYCSAHKPGSAGVKRCMRKNGSKLSSRCVGALAKAGYISKRKVAAK